MVIWTVDRFGNAGHPTKRFDQIRKLIKRGEVKLRGGGMSGKPVIAVFLKKTFNPAATVNRKFSIGIAPGYETIGFAVSEVKDDSLAVLYKGELTTGIKDIKRKMDNRRTYRRRRRYLSRFGKKRMSYKQYRPLAKFKKPRNIRSRHKTSATLSYGVNLHLNLYETLLRLCPLPDKQVIRVMEANTFDIRKMTWGATSGIGYQLSPRGKDNDKHTCFVCGTDKELQQHHLIPRKRQGTDVKENLIYLCKSCHEDIHKGRIYLPINGISQWRALGTMNAISGVLNKRTDIMFIPAYEVAGFRRENNISKGHAEDSMVATMLLFDIRNVTDTPTCAILKKFRRHYRARINSLRERTYKLNGTTVAKNHKKRIGQEDTLSLQEYRKRNPKSVGKLRVLPGIKSINQLRKNLPTITGDVWRINETNRRFVATGVSDKVYLYSPMLDQIIGKRYIRPDKCTRINRHEGIAVIENRIEQTNMLKEVGL